MLDNANIRKDFPMLQKTMHSHPLVYLDSGATTLKPRQVIDAVVNYYENYGANAHRGDYDLSYFVDQEYEQTRKDVAAFLHAADAREIVYTSGASSALNLVAYGYGRKFLQRGDIILTSVAEHASCVLPWMRVAQECGAVVQYVPLDAQGRITLEAVASMMNERVRVVALAHISNVLGYLAPMREICEPWLSWTVRRVCRISRWMSSLWTVIFWRSPRTRCADRPESEYSMASWSC